MSRPSTQSARSQGRFAAGLPLSLRESTLERLRISAQILMVAMIVSEILTLYEIVRGVQPFYWGVQAARAVAFALAYTGYRILGNGDLPPARRLQMARLGMWSMAACAAYQECYFWSHDGQAVLPAGLSRVSLMACLVPVLIPDTLGRSLAFCLAILLTIPLAHWFSLLFGHPPLSGVQLTIVMVRHLISVGAAWMGAATVNQLREAISAEYGNYRLHRKLGQGGFGEVWEATHRHQKRLAAIKIVRQDCDDDTAARFLREAETLSRLECPHTVRLYDYGSSESGQLYLVMELLRGVDLEQLVRRFGPQPAERVTAILSQICLSLEEAHGHQLIHRDIKPANIFLCQVGVEPDFVKVLDFGLVKPHGLAQNLTMSNALVGTPEFMSPEQIQGGALDGRSDIYALGAVGYFLLTGTPVFQADNPMGVLLGHMSKEPQPPSQRLGDRVSSALEEIVLKCLEKHPDHRYPRARDLYQALESLPSWPRSQAARWWAEHGPHAGKAGS